MLVVIIMETNSKLFDNSSKNKFKLVIRFNKKVKQTGNQLNN